jgi:glycosyltransferase involved in cell wall biosynthesis
MPKVLQINVSLNVGSHGRIVNQIGDAILAEGWESFVAYGRSARSSKSQAFKIGSSLDQGFHLLLTRLFDKHGHGSTRATRRLAAWMRNLQPDIVHLHQAHGYYLNLVELIKVLQDLNKPIVWTFHDAWQLTGHCCSFVRFNCQKWQDICHQCPLTSYYPQSWGIDNSTSNHNLKKQFIGSLERLHIVPVSNWLGQVVAESYLKDRPLTVIHNGVDTETFRPLPCDLLPSIRPHNQDLEGKRVFLGVASIWSDLKGLNDFIELSGLLGEDEMIVLIGLSAKQSKTLPSNIVAIPSTNSVEELSRWYNRAAVFLNPSKSESFGLVTAESLACGTPAVVYNTTACPEIIDRETGRVVPLGDYKEMLVAARELASLDQDRTRTFCSYRARTNFDQRKQSNKYVELYKQLF